jgi:diguanylate cyclase (GGDEF)-like protein/PAS domain S-box-containing protein
MGDSPATSSTVTAGFAERVLDSLAATVAVLDDYGEILVVNESWQRFGRANGGGCACVGTNYLAVCDRAAAAGEEAAAAAGAGIRALLDGSRESLWLEYPCHSPAERRWFAARGTVFEQDGRRFVVMTHENVTDRKLAEEALRASETSLRQVLEALPIGLWLLDAGGRIIHGNPAGLRIWAGARFVGPEQFGEYKGWWLASGRPIAAQEWGGARAILHGETSIDEEIEIECFDGTRKIILHSALPLRGADGGIEGAIVVNQDITDRKQIETSLRESEHKWRTLFNVLPVGVSVLDSRFRVVESNPALQSMLRLIPDELAAGEYRTWRFLGAAGRALAAEELPSARAVREQRTVRGAEITIVRGDGTRLVTSVDAAPLPSARATAVVVTSDITAQVQAREELVRARDELELANRELQRGLAKQAALARTDFLTGAYSRRHFYEIAEHELAVARRYRHPLSIILFDADHFKQINDSVGHQAGDEVLKRIAQVATKNLRSADLLARHGGEEFAVLLPHVDRRSALVVAEHIRTAVARERVQTESGQVGVTLSAGVAAARDEDSLDTLVSRADRALYAAKAAGRDRVVAAPADSDEGAGE